MIDLIPEVRWQSGLRDFCYRKNHPDFWLPLRNINRFKYEVDFLLASKTKIVAIEVKSSGIGKHESISEFQKKYSKHAEKEILLSQKDVGNAEMLKLYPIYMLPFIIEDL